MKPIYILDTDHITLLQHNNPFVVSRLSQQLPEHVAVTVISAVEQIKGRLAQIKRAKTSSQVAYAFARFQESLDFYTAIPILPYNQAAAERFIQLRKINKNRPGTQDVRIACIVLDWEAILITRNERDFKLIPGLQIEDWSQPI